jgi:ribosome-binding ATPase YchF (GTP1/OBG family)
VVVVCLWSKFSQIIHVDGSVDAARDVSVINFELILADLAQLERASAKLSKNKSKDPNSEAKSKVYSKITEALESGQPARSLQLTADDSSIIAELNLLTLKPCIYAANVSESDLKDQVKKHIPVCIITQLSTFRARKITMSAT